MRRQVRALTLAALLAGGAAAAEEAAPPRVETEAYSVTLAPVGEVRVGVPASFAVVMSARGGFHVNADYPSSFKPAAGPATVKYPVAKVAKGSALLASSACEKKPAESCGVRASVPVIIDEAGQWTVGGTLAFSVCDDEQCLIEKVAVAAPVTVK